MHEGPGSLDAVTTCMSVSKDARSSRGNRTERTLNHGLISLAVRIISRSRSFLWSINNSINLQSFTLLLSCVVGLIVVSIAMSVVSKARKKRSTEKYNNWLNLLNRRYYC